MKTRKRMRTFEVTYRREAWRSTGWNSLDGGDAKGYWETEQTTRTVRATSADAVLKRYSDCEIIGVREVNE